MAAALRSVRRLQQVLLLPRISVISVRAESGGKSSPHTQISKTLVSFPVKVSHFRQPATGENRNEPLKPVKAPLQDVGESGGQSDRNMQLGQISAQNISGTSHKDDDSSSSSTSDSSSDSESEGEDKRPVTDLHAKNGKSGGGYKGLPSAARKSSSSPGHMSLEKESPIAEQKDRMEMGAVNAEDLQDFAPVMSTEEQSLHTAPLSAEMTLPGADKMETSDETVPTERASPTATADSEEIKIISTSEELPKGGVVTLAPESQETPLPPTSEELLVEFVKMSAPESRKAPILLSTKSEELAAGGIETLAPESVEIQMLSTTTSEELAAGGIETLAPESVETQMLSTTTSEELPTGGVETLAPESVETQMLSTTASEELLVEEGAADLHESHSPMEPCAAPQEPFDNTKYQNLQHFTYTPFTFVDMDVEMAKYRLPQPSSGRPSPRH